METAGDVTTEYIQMPVGSLSTHKFKKYVVGNAKYNALPETSAPSNGFLYMVEVYVDNFMSLVIPVSHNQLRHAATAVMTGIQDVFPPDEDDSNDLISKKKLLKSRDSTPHRRHYLDSTLMVWQKYVARGGEEGKVAHSPERMDTRWKKGHGGHSVQGIQIRCGKTPPRLYLHPSRS